MATEFRFPDDFYWGAATSAYQVEGGNENTDWAQAAREGKVPPAGRLADHYHRFEEDFDIAKELGHNAHRFSIEWARIEPREGEWDHKEIEHYREVLKALRARNIEPFVTLWHFTLPLWFSESGGFERKDSPELYARYCNFVVDELSDLATHFTTMNEENIYSGMGWLRGAWPPFKRFTLADLFRDVSTEHRETDATASRSFWTPVLWYRVISHLKTAHRMVYEQVKEAHPEVLISFVHQVHVFESNWNPYNKLKALVAHYILNGSFSSLYQYCDEIGLNYYHYKKFGDTKTYPKTDMGWNSNPERIYDALMYVAHYKKPIIISETGLADHEDDMRPDYIRTQIRAVARALNDGADVRAYMYWSLLDNYEWDLGIGMRFGLVEIDYDTLERRIRPSAYVYKQIIKANGNVEKAGEMDTKG